MPRIPQITPAAPHSRNTPSPFQNTAERITPNNKIKAKGRISLIPTPLKSFCSCARTQSAHTSKCTLSPSACTRFSLSSRMCRVWISSARKRYCAAPPHWIQSDFVIAFHCAWDAPLSARPALSRRRYSSEPSVESSKLPIAPPRRDEICAKGMSSMRSAAERTATSPVPPIFAMHSPAVIPASTG